jgi:hypothetical protein
MSRHDDETRVRHMLEHAIEAMEMTRGRARSDLDTDRQLNLSSVRLLEIVFDHEWYHEHATRLFIWRKLASLP